MRVGGAWGILETRKVRPVWEALRGTHRSISSSKSTDCGDEGEGGGLDGRLQGVRGVSEGVILGVRGRGGGIRRRPFPPRSPLIRKGGLQVIEG